MNYKSIAKSIIGRSHIKSDLPCQDYSLTGTNNDVIFAIVSDGCGSKEHSEIASQYICEILLKKITSEFDCIYKMEDGSAKEYINGFVKDEMGVLAKDKGFKSYDDLLATYLFVAVKDNKHICVRCGDGGIVLFFQDGSFGTMVEEKNGYANETCYYNHPECVDRMDIEKGETVLLGAFIYCDGVNENDYSEDEIVNLVKMLYSFSHKSIEDNQKDLEDFLKIAVRNSADDCSSAILVADKDDFVVKKATIVTNEEPKEKAKNEEPPLLEHDQKEAIITDIPAGKVVDEQLGNQGIVEKTTIESVKQPIEAETKQEKDALQEKSDFGDERNSEKQKTKHSKILAITSKTFISLFKSKKNKKSFREFLIKYHVIDYEYIYIDTCSLLHSDIYGFLGALDKQYHELKEPNKCHIIIHESVVTELKKIKNRESDVSKKAEAILQTINDKTFSCLQVGGQKDIEFGDLSLYRAISAIRTIGSVLLITEDKKLKHDCILLNNLLSQKGKNVDVISIGAIK